ncbi:hypothetical protein DY000_02023120 [Brassica cretica]|uniref:Uncharacterized protein n=1 Tax=Brassica cretica TaxID=69181 RepID=A0ABQ7EHZ5_BRACR|nr:hypothetical protein DY000_02023120 [Brassica cretica]
MENPSEPLKSTTPEVLHIVISSSRSGQLRKDGDANVDDEDRDSLGRSAEAHRRRRRARVSLYLPSLPLSLSLSVSVSLSVLISFFFLISKKMDEMELQGDDHDGGVEKVQAPVCWSSRDVLSVEGSGGSDIN